MKGGFFKDTSCKMDVDHWLHKYPECFKDALDMCPKLKQKFVTSKQKKEKPSISKEVSDLRKRLEKLPTQCTKSNKETILEIIKNAKRKLELCT